MSLFEKYRPTHFMLKRMDSLENLWWNCNQNEIKKTIEENYKCLSNSFVKIRDKYQQEYYPAVK